MRIAPALGFVLAVIAGPAGLGQAPPSDPPTAPVRVARLADAAGLRRRLGLTPEYENLARVDAIRIAVLDYGFEGMGPGRPYLPDGTELIEHYDPEFVRRNGLGDPEYRKGFEPGNRHGRDMAQIIWAMTGSRPRGPQFVLLNANGPTMLRRAVRYAIERQVDVILFSGSFEGGGNGDGRGPIDHVVDEAVGRGILWINASGNQGGRVFTAPVRPLSDGYLRLRDGADIASIRFRNRVDENTVIVTLTWNDYREEEDAGTDKDLDLFVEDPSGRVVGSGEKVQTSGDREVTDAETRNPRERVVLANLPALPVVSNPEATYRIRVRARAGRFEETDRIRILVTAARETFVLPGGTTPEEAVTFLDASNRSEIYPPADHSGVLTVGDASPSSSVGPTLDRRIKPDAVIADSRVDFTDGLITSGSSNAAAQVAGVVVLLKAAEPAFNPRHLLRLARQGPLLSQGDRASLGLRSWQTPGRARLADLVRTGR
ncbi:S8 family serine peptidase [Tundrisphaera sp. TA3]|uniref:S8 family serine peptidase n=1 Tax=Tundrisphaera sp. TA3 TaxID=3435775 RepID=UPI003EBC136D